MSKGFHFGTKMAVALALAASFQPAQALQIRGFGANPSRYNRFTGFPTTPAVNASSFYDGTRYTGVGWWASSPGRQFALVSPQHIVMATHYAIGAGEVVRFLNSSGVVVEATIASTTLITTAGPTSTDLTLARFTAPVPAGVTPFAYLNVTGPAMRGNSRHSNLVMFGHYGKAGTGRISGFLTAAVSGFTELYYTAYPHSGGTADDSHVEGGDSGSPSFALMADGTPILAGIHCAVDDDDEGVYSFDTFIPKYISELNAAMLADGYAMTPAYVMPTSLEPGGSTTPELFRRVASGTAGFTVTNLAGSTADNVVVSLTFASGQAPDSVSGSGWIADVSGPLTWTFHRANLSASATGTLTASWSSVPPTASLMTRMDWKSDGSQQRSIDYDLEPMPSYAEWSAGLAQPLVTDDPDGDGMKNLIEYAFGGNATSGSQVLSGSVRSGTVFTVAGGTATLRFPVRADSQTRGLTYVLEFSDNLTSWTQTQPGGTSISYPAYSPAISGFKESVVTFPAGATRKFARVRVVLDENAAGMTIP